MAVVAIFFVTILLRLSFIHAIPINPPSVHDEFSYLLSADTFVQGRLANPPHPMWMFLDTIHVLQHPTYSSMYPPAQGAALAMGQLLGNPWIGVLMTTALMCSAILWMLQAWLPGRWALLGAIFVLARVGVFSYWMNSYWGGSVAALGGALVVGSFARLNREPRTFYALILVLGVGILANSRPLEGAILCLPVAFVLIIRPLPAYPLSKARAQILMPISLGMVLIVAFMGYYNYRVTGSSFLFPHTVDDRAHLNSGNFVWDKPHVDISDPHPQLVAFYRTEVRLYPKRVADLGRNWWGKVVLFQEFFMGRALLLPLLALPWALFDRRPRFLFLQFALCCVGVLTVVGFFPHYAAPALATFTAILVQSFRHLRQWKIGAYPLGMGLSRLAVLLTLAPVPISIAQAWTHTGTSTYIAHPVSWAVDRARIEKQLDQQPGKHLVIVRYSEKHNPNNEWVYNKADIDNAYVVWAREIPTQEVTPLLHYFHERHVWLVEADKSPIVLKPYSPLETAPPVRVASRADF